MNMKEEKQLVQDRKKAAKYILERFKEIGLEPGAKNGSFLQTFAVDAKNAANVFMNVNGKNGIY